MLPPMPLPPERQLRGVIDAWRCTSCDHLMYNIDAEGLPVPGAPMPKYWSETHNKVCNACYAMADSAHFHDHFRKAHEEWKKEEAGRKHLWERHTGRRDYFTGNY